MQVIISAYCDGWFCINARHDNEVIWVVTVYRIVSLFRGFWEECVASIGRLNLVQVDADTVRKKCVFYVRIQSP